MMIAQRKTKREFSRARAILLVALAPVTFGVFTVALGLVGWSQQLYDGSIHSIVAVVLRSLGDFALSPKNFEDGNSISGTSAVFGLLTVYSSAAIIIVSVLRELRRKLLARYVLRRHHLVVGDSSLAKRVGAIWSDAAGRTLRIAPLGTPTPGFLQRVVRHAYDESLSDMFAMRRARHVFFDLDDDARTVALVLRTLPSVAKRPSQIRGPLRRDWVCVVRDDRFADHLEAAVCTLRTGLEAGLELPRIIRLQPERLIARVAIEKGGLCRPDQAPRSHVLVVGYGLVGKFLVEEILDSTLRDRASPVITVLAPEATRQMRRFSLTHRDDHRFDVAFLEAEILEDLTRVETHDTRSLLARDSACAFTTIFLTSDDLRESTLSRIAIHAVQRKLSRMTCPILSRVQEGDDVDLWLPSSAASPGPANSIGYGLSDEALRAYLREPDATTPEPVLSAKSDDAVGP